MTQIGPFEYELDTGRGVLYLHSLRTGISVLRMCRIPDALVDEMLCGHPAIGLTTTMPRSEGIIVGGGVVKIDSVSVEVRENSFVVTRKTGEMLFEVQSVPKTALTTLEKEEFTDITIGHTKPTGNPEGMDEQQKWEALMASIRRAAKILNLDLTEQDMPEYLNWYVGRNMHKDLWAQVYVKTGGREQEEPVSNPGPVDWKPKFVMYHATPAKNIELVKQEGIKRSIQKIPTHRTPTEPVVYFADDVGTVIDYAEQSWEYHEMADPRWAIFKIEYDEFPTQLHADVVWGIRGVYWADMDIPPEHVKLYGVFDVEQHKWISVLANPNTADGTCYEDAWRVAIQQDDGYLVHGSIQLSAEGPRVNHAWVELPTGWVWEPQTKQYFTIENFKMLRPIEEHRYTVEQAAIMVARVGKHGPWSDEERMEYIGR